MPREDGVLDLGDDRLFVAEDVGEERLAGADLGDQVAPHLVLDRLAPIAAGLQFAEGPGSLRRHAAVSGWVLRCRRNGATACMNHARPAVKAKSTRRDSNGADALRPHRPSPPRIRDHLQRLATRLVQVEPRDVAQARPARSRSSASRIALSLFAEWHDPPPRSTRRRSSRQLRSRMTGIRCVEGVNHAGFLIHRQHRPCPFTLCKLRQRPRDLVATFGRARWPGSNQTQKDSECRGPRAGQSERRPAPPVRIGTHSAASSVPAPRMMAKHQVRPLQ